MPSFNLSTAKNLKYLALRFGRPNVQWITATLQTIESKNLQGIALQFGANAFEHDHGSDSSAMARPRPPVGPILDFAFYPFGNYVWGGRGEAGFEGLCIKSVAGADQERTH